MGYCIYFDEILIEEYFLKVMIFAQDVLLFWSHFHDQISLQKSTKLGMKILKRAKATFQLKKNHIILIIFTNITIQTKSCQIISIFIKNRKVLKIFLFIFRKQRIFRAH
jgi:hypothetical protein